MATCDNCGAETVALVILDSPKGEYGLCRRCYVEPKSVPTKAKKKKSKKSKTNAAGPLFGDE